MNNSILTEAERHRRLRQRRALPSFEMLRSVLSSELDFLSDDDIEHAPEDEIANLLEEVGGSSGGPSPTLQAEIEKLSASERNTDITPAYSPFFVPRDTLIEACLSALQHARNIVLTGAAGSGKSLFLNELFCPNPKVRSVFPRIVRVDCAALR